MPLVFINNSSFDSESEARTGARELLHLGKHFSVWFPSQGLVLVWVGCDVFVEEDTGPCPMCQEARAWANGATVKRNCLNDRSMCGMNYTPWRHG